MKKIDIKIFDDPENMVNNNTLNYMTWQMSRLAAGDFSQRMEYPPEFAEAFNKVAQQLEEQHVLHVKELSKLQDFTSLILDNTPDMLIAFDKTEKAVLTSSAFIKNSLFGSLSQVRGKSFWELFSQLMTKETVRELGEAFICAMEHRRTCSLKLKIDLRQNGEYRSYDVGITPLLFENDVFVGTMIVVRG